MFNRLGGNQTAQFYSLRKTPKRKAKKSLADDFLLLGMYPMVLDPGVNLPDH